MDEREPDPKQTVLIWFGFKLSFVRHRAAFALRFFRGKGVVVSHKSFVLIERILFPM